MCVLFEFLRSMFYKSTAFKVKNEDQETVKAFEGLQTKICLRNFHPAHGQREPICVEGMG